IELRNDRCRPDDDDRLPSCARRADLNWIEQKRHWIARVTLAGTRLKPLAGPHRTPVRHQGHVRERFRRGYERRDRAEAPTIALEIWLFTVEAVVNNVVRLNLLDHTAQDSGFIFLVGQGFIGREFDFAALDRLWSMCNLFDEPLTKLGFGLQTI